MLYHKELCNFPKLVLVTNIRIPTDIFLYACTPRGTSQGNEKRKFKVYENAACKFWVIRTGPGFPLTPASKKRRHMYHFIRNFSQSCLHATVPVLLSTAPVSVSLVLCIHSRTNSITIS